MLIIIRKASFTFSLLHMDRNGLGLLLALIAWGEPILIGLLAHQQWIVFLGLGNLLVILLRYRFSHHSSLSEKLIAEKKYYTSFFNAKLHANETPKKPADYQWMLALIGFIWWIIVYFLLPYHLFTKLAGLLIWYGVIYWILAGFILWFKKIYRSIFWKISILAILLGIWRWILWSSEVLDYMSTKVQAPTIITWNTSSGELLSGTTTTEILATGASITWTMQSNQPMSGTIAGTPTTGSATETTASASLPTWGLSFAYVVPAIVKKFNLPTNGRDVIFTNISKTSEIYPYFKAGYYKKFFGLGVNPNTITSCNVYFVMLGLAQNRNPSYTPSTVFSVFAKEAAARWQTYGCEPGWNVTAANLP